MAIVCLAVTLMVCLGSCTWEIAWVMSREPNAGNRLAALTGGWWRRGSELDERRALISSLKLKPTKTDQGGVRELRRSFVADPDQGEGLSAGNAL